MDEAGTLDYWLNNTLSDDAPSSTPDSSQCRNLPPQHISAGPCDYVAAYAEQEPLLSCEVRTGGTSQSMMFILVMTSFGRHFAGQCSLFPLELPQPSATKPIARNTELDDTVFNQFVSSGSAQDALPFPTFENTSPAAECVHKALNAGPSQSLSNDDSTPQYNSLLPLQVSSSIVALLLNLSIGILQCRDLEPSLLADIHDVHNSLKSDGMFSIDDWPWPLELAPNNVEVDEALTQVSEQIPVQVSSLAEFLDTDY